MLRALYWFGVGAVLGVGVLAILSIGALLLLIGCILLVVGAFVIGARGVWAALVGFGLAPLCFLVRDLAQPSTSLVYTHTSQVLAYGFGAIALLGLALGLLAWRRRWSVAV